MHSGMTPRELSDHVQAAWARRVADDDLVGQPCLSAQCFKGASQESRPFMSRDANADRHEFGKRLLANLLGGLKIGFWSANFSQQPRLAVPDTVLRDCLGAVIWKPRCSSRPERPRVPPGADLRLEKDSRNGRRLPPCPDNGHTRSFPCG